MKKNRFLRAASGLLIATLISTCAISGTYAKYVTEGSVGDTARVADFGVVINAGGTLYSSAYVYSGNTPTTANAGTTSGYATVNYAGSAGDNLVAPGTQSYGTGLSFGVTGTPEVSVTVKAEITAEDIFLKKGTWAVMTQADFNVNAANFESIIATTDLYTLSSGVYTKASSGSYTDGTTYYYITDSATVTSTYYPVVYTLAGNTTYTGSVTTADAQGVATTIANTITNSNATASTSGLYKTVYSGISQDLPANTNLGTSISGSSGLGDLNLTWTWSFDQQGANTYDPEDTILGDLIAQKNGTMDDGSVVVYNSATSGAVTTYTAVGISNSNYKVTYDGSTVAYLQTSFAIELSVTQID